MAQRKISNFSAHKHVPTKIGFSVLALALLVTTVFFLSQYKSQNVLNSNAASAPATVSGQIISHDLNQCIVVVKSNNGSSIVQVGDCNNTAESTWVRSGETETRDYQMNGLCLNTVDMAVYNGAPVTVTPCGNGSGSVLTWGELQGGYFKVHATNECLTETSTGTLQLQQCIHDGNQAVTSQRWTFLPPYSPPAPTPAPKVFHITMNDNNRTIRVSSGDTISITLTGINWNFSTNPQYLFIQGGKITDLKTGTTTKTYQAIIAKMQPFTGNNNFQTGVITGKNFNQNGTSENEQTFTLNVQITN